MSSRVKKSERVVLYFIVLLPKPRIDNWSNKVLVDSISSACVNVAIVVFNLCALSGL